MLFQLVSRIEMGSVASFNIMILVGSVVSGEHTVQNSVRHHVKPIYGSSSFQGNTMWILGLRIRMRYPLKGSEG